MKNRNLFEGSRNHEVPDFKYSRFMEDCKNWHLSPEAQKALEPLETKAIDELSAYVKQEENLIHTDEIHHKEFVSKHLSDYMDIVKDNEAPKELRMKALEDHNRIFQQYNSDKKEEFKEDKNRNSGKIFAFLSLTTFFIYLCCDKDKNSSKHHKRRKHSNS